MNAITPHPIPDAALESDIAILAQKGAGKTYLARGLVERLLDAGRRVIILDPLASWWGLKALADGQPGYGVTVIGGEHGDLPLDPQDGERLGEFLAAAAMSVVVDVSELRRGEMIAFTTAFLRALYRKNKDALWLVLEEADVFAPQSPLKDATFLLHEVEQISRRGRAKGFRLISITQRPARVHKDLLSQASTLALLRIRAPQDRAAVEDWVRGNADQTAARGVIDSLASLEIGEGWVWSPDNEILARARFPTIRTLDTSFTPKAGEAREAAPELAQAAGLEALRALLCKPATPAALPGLAQREHERGYAEGREAGFHEGLQHMAAQLRARFGDFLDQLGGVDAKALNAPAGDPDDYGDGEMRFPEPDSRPAIGAAAHSAVLEPAQADPPPAGLAKPQSHLLAVLAAAERPFGANLDKVLLAFLAGVSHRSSGFANNLGSLRGMGLIEYPASGQVRLTARGRAGAPPTKIAATNDQVQRLVLAKLPRPQQRLLEVLLEAHPDGCSRTILASRADVSPTSSGLANNLGALRGMGLITYPSVGFVAVTNLLFPYPR